MNHFAKILTLGTALIASASVASATPIAITNNNVTYSLTGATGAPVAVGAPVYSNTAILNSGTFTGTLTQTAFHDSSNPFNCGAVACLTFELQFTNNGTDTVEGITIGSANGGFSSFLTDVGYVAGAGTAPASVVESSNGKIGFNFTAPGYIGASDTVFIQTNAANFSIGAVTVTDFQSANTPGAVPSAATPEPSSLIMLGTGLVSAAGMLVRRRRLV